MSLSIEPCYWLGNSSSCARQSGAVTDMWTEPCKGCNHDGTRIVGWPPTSGFLASECPFCEGTGNVVTGKDPQRRRWDCTECRSTGWIIHEDIPAFTMSEPRCRYCANPADGNEGLDNIDGALSHESCRTGHYQSDLWKAEQEIERLAGTGHGGCGLDLCPECKAEEPS